MVGWIPCSVLVQGRGAWFCLTLVCQTLLTPHRRPYPFWEVDGGGEGKSRDGRRGGKGALG